MALDTLQNFYSASVATNWATGTGNRYVDTLPSQSTGYLVVNPSNLTKREIIRYTAKGTDGGGNYITISERGVGGTTDQVHVTGEAVRMNITAEHYSAIQDEIDTLVTSIATKVSLTGNETVAGVKTFSSSPIVPTPTTDYQVSTKKYADDLAIAGSPDASTSAKGIVEEATNAEIIAGTGAGSTGARLFVNPTQVAISGASKIIMTDSNGKLDSSLVSPSMFSTEHLAATNTPRAVWADAEAYIAGAGTTLSLEISTYGHQTRVVTSDWASAANINSTIVLGDYVYVLLYQTTTAYRVYRYDKTDLSAGGTLMTFSGQSLIYVANTQYMTTDGTYFYFTHKAGNSANNYVISKYSLSGTTLTYVSDITCGATAAFANGFSADTSGNIYGVHTDKTIRKFNSSGTLQRTNTGMNGNNDGLYNFTGHLYTQTNNQNFKKTMF